MGYSDSIEMWGILNHRSSRSSFVPVNICRYIQGLLSTDIGRLCAKGPYVSAKEPYISAKYSPMNLQKSPVHLQNKKCDASVVSRVPTRVLQCVAVCCSVL